MPFEELGDTEDIDALRGNRAFNILANRLQPAERPADIRSLAYSQEDRHAVSRDMARKLNETLAEVDSLIDDLGEATTNVPTFLTVQQPQTREQRGLVPKKRTGPEKPRSSFGSKSLDGRGLENALNSYARPQGAHSSGIADSGEDASSSGRSTWGSAAATSAAALPGGLHRHRFDGGPFSPPRRRPLGGGAAVVPVWAPRGGAKTDGPHTSERSPGHFYYDPAAHHAGFVRGEPLLRSATARAFFGAESLPPPPPDATATAFGPPGRSSALLGPRCARPGDGAREGFGDWAVGGCAVPPGASPRRGLATGGESRGGTTTPSREPGRGWTEQQLSPSAAYQTAYARAMGDDRPGAGSTAASVVAHGGLLGSGSPFGEPPDHSCWWDHDVAGPGAGPAEAEAEAAARKFMARVQRAFAPHPERFQAFLVLTAALDRLHSEFGECGWAPEGAAAQARRRAYAEVHEPPPLHDAQGCA